MNDLETVEGAVAEAIAPKHLTAADFDALLAEAAKEYREKRGARPSMPQVLNDYRQVENFPGVYLRDMCLETEIRAIEMYEIIDTSTVSGMVRAGVGLASLVLYRIDLPADEAEARAKVRDYVRGEVPEDALFVSLSETEVGRMFKNSDELNAVLDLAGFNLKKDGESDPNA